MGEPALPGGGLGGGQGAVGADGLHDDACGAGALGKEGDPGAAGVHETPGVFEHPEDPGVVGAEEGLDDVVEVGEVPVERTGRDARFLGDVGEADTPPAAGGVAGLGGLQERSARGLGAVCPCASLGFHWRQGYQDLT